MPNKLYITKVLSDGYGEAVMLETNDPSLFGELDKHYIAPPPTFLIHPSLNPKEGEWIEQWREGWEWRRDGLSVWYDSTKQEYDKTNPDDRRKVLLPLVKKKEESANFMQVVPDSHSWSSIEMLINFLKHHGNFNKKECSVEYLIKGLENTLANGYQLTQSPPSLQEREKGMKWVKASERLPDEDDCRSNIIVKLKGSKYKAWFHQDNKQFDVSNGTVTLSFGSGNYGGIEWLDESQDTAKQSKL